MNERRGRGRPPKRSYNNDKDNKNGLNFLGTVIRKPRTKTKKERERLALRLSSQCSEISHDQILEKKVVSSESGRDEELSPGSFVDYSTVGIRDIVIPGPIPDFDALFMDDSLFVNLFQNIPDLI